MMKAAPQTPQTPILTRIRAPALAPRLPAPPALQIPTRIPRAAAAMPVNNGNGGRKNLQRIVIRKQTAKKASRTNCKNTWREPKKSDDAEVENENNAKLYYGFFFVFLKIKERKNWFSPTVPFIFNSLPFDFLFQGFSTCTCCHS